MSSHLNDLANNRQLIKLLGISTITSMSFLGGLSCCLSAWIIPLLRRSSSPKTTFAQFDLMIYKGFLYLQTSSRLLGAALATLTFLTYRSNDPVISKQFRFWAIALGMLLPLAPYEIYFIFPSNDRIKEMGENLKARNSDELDTQERSELDGLLTKWQRRNGGRFITPAVASVVGLFGMLS